MIFKQIHKLFSFYKLFKLVLGMAIVLQLVIITYNHFSGYHELNDFTEFVLRLIRGIIYSVVAGFAIAYPDLFVIQYLNKYFQWNKGVMKRAIVQFTLTLIIAFVVSSLITLFAHWVSSYRQGLQNVLFNNLLIYTVVNAFFMSILEAWIYLEESLKEKARAEKLQKELLAKQLNESREQLNSLLSNLAGAAYRCYYDEHYTMQYISEKIFDITGYHAADLMGNAKQTFASIIHPDDRDFCRQSIQEAIDNKTHYEFEYRIVHQNGKIVWVNENGKGILNDKDEIIYLDGIIVDISWRKEAESEAQDSERRYRDLMDLLPQPVFELNLQSEIVLSNKAGDEFFGPLPADPNKKQSALDCFVKEDRARIIENFKKSAQGITTEPGEFTAIKKDGSHCPVMVFGNSIIRNGEIVGRRGIIIDITERKNYEMGLLKENHLSKFEVLKSQINPHFMFNSLNVLSGLISKDVDKAQQFIDEFSHIYRYVLETIEQPVSTLEKELDFMRSYLFLQQIRYGEDLSYSVNIPVHLLKLALPPLSLQVVLENATKHNIINESRPLIIEVYNEGNYLVVKNNIQPKISAGRSTGLGLKNLTKRYALISSLAPVFSVETNHYLAKLPLIDIENDERTDN